jgi:two-component system, response regulator PdtaR
MPITTQATTDNHNAAILPIGMALARRVLIVDDDPMICLLLGEMIEHMGHGVCGSASSEAVTLALVAIHRPDLLIVDAWLGEDSGLDTVTKILAMSFIPHIFMSGDIQRLRNLRPKALLLEKPFKEPALKLAIQRVLTDSPRAKR